VNNTLLNFAKKMMSEFNKYLNLKKLKKNNVYIHPDSKLSKFTTIGFGTRITGPAFIDSKQEAPVIIGKYCAIAHNLRIRTRNHYTGYINLQCNFQNKHGFPSLYTTKGSIVIGNNVWIGDNVIILSGVQVGDGAVIGAGSIVTKDIPPYAIAAGNPAKVIKKRFNDEVIDQLTQVKWWDWSEEKIQRNGTFFEADLQNQSEEQSFVLHKLIVD
jgi:virginiamycin A acetyltransferase